MEEPKSQGYSKKETEGKASLFDSPVNTLAVYTILKMLIKMRSHLGLEAMLCYIEKYLAILEENNPEVRTAVLKALSFVSVEKIYLEAMKK